MQKYEHSSLAQTSLCLSVPMRPSILHFHGWRRGNAIKTPKIEKSSNIIHVGNDCFRFLFMSSLSALLMFSSVDLTFSIICLASPSSDGFAEACSAMSCSDCCCWLYFSTYSGNSFLNVGLLNKSIFLSQWISILQLYN